MRTFFTAVVLLVTASCAARQPVHSPLADISTCRQTITAGGRAGAPIAWSGPGDYEDRERLDAWCSGVGPAVLIETPAGREPRAPIESVAFVTWNTHVGGGDIAGLLAAVRRGELTGGEPVAHVVLLLQEVFREGADVPAPTAGRDAGASRIAAAPPRGARTDIVALARTLGLAMLYVPSMRNGRADGGPPEDRGNAILTSLPLSNVAAIELPFDRQRRVAVAATISGLDADGVPWHLRVASSHLNATAGADRLWLFASGVRAAQARSLAAALGSVEPAILGSDLNTWADGPREPAVRELRTQFPDTGHPGLAPTFRLGLMLDYLFFRLPDGWTGVSTRVDDRFGSDHHPLLGRIQID